MAKPLASGSNDSSVRLWDTTGNLKILHGHTSGVQSVAWSSSKPWPVAVMMESSFGRSADRCLKTYTRAGQVVSSLSPDGGRPWPVAVMTSL